MCGNLAGDGSNEGVSTEKRFGSSNLIEVCFLGVLLLRISNSCKELCSNKDGASLDEQSPVLVVVFRDLPSSVYRI